MAPWTAQQKREARAKAKAQTEGTQAEIEGPSPASTTLDDRSVLIILTLRRPTLVKKIGDTAAAIESEANLDRLRVSAELLKSKPFDKIKKIDGQCRNFLRGEALPSLVMSSGAWRVPLARVTAVHERLEVFEVERENAVEEFAEAYDVDVAAGRLQLSSVAGLVRYEDKADIIKMFEMGWRYISTSTPEKLAAYAPDILKAEIEKGEALLRREVDVIRDALRTSFQTLITHATDRLTITDGKAPIFRDSIVTNMNQFLATFADRNLADDAALASLVDQAQNIMEGVDDPQKLRDNEELRRRIAGEFGKLTDVLDSELAAGSAPARRVKIED